MNKPELKRIYFDTNALYRWPNPPEKWWQVANLTTHTGTELYFPATVEAELESQFLRRLADTIGSLRSNYRDLRITCQKTIEVDTPEFIGADEQRTHFRQRTDTIKTHYKIVTIPLTTSPLSLFVDMAISRKPPFEEKAIGKEKDKERFVTGLQDAVIFSSVLEHMSSAPIEARCAFVSDDDIFQNAEIRSLIEQRGLNLEIIRTPAAAFEDLWDHLWGEAKKASQKEAGEIAAELNAHKDLYAEQLRTVLLPSQVRTGWFQTAVSINRLTILEIGSVYPDFPPSEHLPPQKYSRPEGSEVKITATFKVDIRALVSTSISSFNVFASNDDDDEGTPRLPPSPEPSPTLSRKKYEQRFSVTLVGTAHGDRIEDIHVVEAAPEKY